MNIPSLVRYLLGAVALTLASTFLAAQQTNFFVEDLTAETGNEVLVNVKAVSIQDLVGVQLSVAWDLEKFDYVGVGDIVMDGTPADNFNQTQLDSGRIGFLLIDPNLVGFGLQDTVHLFTLKLMPKSMSSMTTEIAFASAPLRFSAMDNMNNRIDCAKVNGTIRLENPNGLVSFAEDPRFSVAPNPFVDALRVSTSLNYAAEGTLEVLDLRGRTLHQQTVRLRAGANSVTLAAEKFPAAGAYVIRLSTDREQLSRKVILLERQ